MSVRHVTGALCIKEKQGYADKEVVDREAKRSYHVVVSGNKKITIDYGGAYMLKKSCKGSACIAQLEKDIDEIAIHQGLTRNDKTNGGVAKAQNLTSEELKQKAIELKGYKSEVPNTISYPTALQVVIDENLEGALGDVEKNIKLALDLRTLQTRYEIELLWFIYLSELKKDVMLVGEDDEENDLTGPEMVKKLVEILMLNREQDRDVINAIKRALLEWKA